MHLGSQLRSAPVAVALVVLALGAGPASAITWGQPDTEHHNVGSMLVNYPGFGLIQWCSGTLIHPQIFLTAGHCTVGLEDFDVSKVWVTFDPMASRRSTRLPIDRVVSHPDYHWGPTSNPHDVGALVLSQPVTDIAPAQLPPEGFLDALHASGELGHGAGRAQFTLVGYGGTLHWPPPEITYADRRQYSLSEFRALLRSWLRMSQNQATGDGGTCYGDSGGPSFWTEPDGTEILVGVTSWGDVPCVSSAFNYRVDTADTLDFIDDLIASLAP